MSFFRNHFAAVILFAILLTPFNAWGATEPSLEGLASATEILQNTHSTQPENLLRSTSTPASLSLNSSNNLEGYELLDDIQDMWQMNFKHHNETERSLISSPFGPPAGGLALFQSTKGNSYFGCDCNIFYKFFNFDKEYLPGSKVTFYAKFKRISENNYYETAAVLVHAYSNEQLVEKQIIGTDGGYYSRRWNNSFKNGFQFYPNGYSGLIEFTITVPFDSLRVSLFNYACIGENYTILDHVMFKGITDTPELIGVEASPDSLMLDKTGCNLGDMVFKAETSGEAAVNFELHHPASGMILELGQKNAVEQNGSFFATMSWSEKFPEGFSFQPGTYKLVATLDSQSAEDQFAIATSEGNFTGLGLWSKNSKDPTNTVLSSVSIRRCPTCPWNQMLFYSPGYFSTLNISDPVNIVSGNYIWQHEDLILKSRMKLDLARIYNSLDRYNGDFGRGWSSHYLSRLVFQTNAVIFVNSDGSRVKFEREGDNFTVENGIELKLQYNPDSELYTLSHPYGETWAFNTEGKILRMSSGCCGLGAIDSINFEYDSSGKLNKVSNPAGQWIEFEYGQNGKIIKALDSTGREVLYAYDNENNLVSYTDPVGRTTAYEYDGNGFLTRVEQPGSRITRIEYSDYRISRLIDVKGETSIFSWNEDAPELILTDAYNTAHVYSFNDNWRFNGYSVPTFGIEKTFNSEGKALTGFQNSQGATRKFVFVNGRLHKKIDEVGYENFIEFDPVLTLPTLVKDTLDREWQYEWDDKGNLIAKTDPDGNTTSYTYDRYNNKLIEEDPEGRTTNYTYSADGNFLLTITDPMGDVTSFTYDLRGNKVSYKLPTGSITRSEYDLLNRETRSIYHDGRWLKTFYNQSGFVSKTLESDGTEVRRTYDSSGKVLSETTADGAVTQFEYDECGRKISTIDPLGNITQTIYDDLGRVTSIIHPDQSFTRKYYDSEGRTIKTVDECGAETLFEYDAAGRLVARIDALGNRQETQYDIAGRVIACKDSLGRITRTIYDENDRVVKTIFPDGSTQTNQYYEDGRKKAKTDPLGNITTYEYNRRGQQTKIILPNGAIKRRYYNSMGHEIKTVDPLGRITQTLYDDNFRPYITVNPAGGETRRYWDSASGFLIAEKRPDDSITSTTYDLLDRPVVKYNANGEAIRFEYDLAGRQVARIDALGRRTLSIYDNRGREIKKVYPEGNIVRKTYDNCGRMLSLTDGAGRTWRWEYDLPGRVIKETDPMGHEVSFQYNAVGKMTSRTNARNQTTNYTYDCMNRLVTISYPDGSLASFTYDLMGRELTRSGPGGSCIKEYDCVGNVVSEKYSGPKTPESYKGWTYEYDLAGNRIKAIDSEGKEIKYSYNKLDQVIKIEYGKNHQIIYERDPVGRILRIERKGTESVYNYDSVGRPLEIKHFRYDSCPRKKLIAARIYEYDSVGNILSMTDEQDKKTSYQYNANDWLVKVTYPDSNTAHYGYNGAGDRTSRRINDEPVIAYEYDAAGRMITSGEDEYAYDADGNMLSDSVASYSWNSDNRLVRVEKTSGDCKHKKNRRGHGFGHLKHGKET
ncbi:MAG: DUF6531 domain-containing protein, partial [Candidatus Rifleibacteriota bacterium]